MRGTKKRLILNLELAVAVLNAALGLAGLVFTAIGLVLSAFFLFQVRPLYAALLLGVLIALAFARGATIRVLNRCRREGKEG